MKRMFKKTLRKRQRLLSKSSNTDALTSPPTQEMLDIGLTAAMKSTSICVVGVRSAGSNSGDVVENNNSRHSNSCPTACILDEELSEDEELEELLDPLQSVTIDDFLNSFRDSASDFLSKAYQ